MSLRYHYKLDRVGRAVLPLGGRSVRPRPVIAVTLIGPTNSRLVEALLDTGADDTVFPEVLALKLGVDLSGAPQGIGAGVGKAAGVLKYAQVTLRLTGGNERREWTAWIGFASLPLAYPVLGFAGCLQYFNSLFLGDREEVELMPNRLYPGT
jgi:hypothetical protein